MENQEEKAAKKEAEESWRKCPICAQEFQDFLPAIRHLEEHVRRESQMVKIELGAKDYLAKRIAQEFSPHLQGSEADKKKARVGARSGGGRLPTKRKACYPWLATGSSRR